MTLEDDLVAALCDPGCRVNRVQAVAAILLAMQGALRWRLCADIAAGGKREAIYHLGTEDFEWLEHAHELAMQLAGELDNAGVVDGIMPRLEKLVGDTRFDIAAVAMLNAGRWIWLQYTSTPAGAAVDAANRVEKIH